MKLSPKLSLLVSVILTFVLISAMFWFMGARIQEQVTELTKTLPSTISNAKAKLETTSIGKRILEKTSSQETSDKVYSFGGNFFNSTFGAFGDLYVVLFLGIFFTFSPKTYVNGFLSLIPSAGKPRAKLTIERIGFTLTKWLKGQMFAMLIVFTLTAIVLTILGMPMAIALALIAGLLNFIPNFGPLLAMIPAVLIALTQGANKAILVAVLYILIQILESNIITPSIQKKLINIPPALTILAQLFMGILTGGWGLVLATPLVAILMVVVQETYVKRINGELQ
jgi:predicted PurR-regulated permease PerM